MKAVLVAVGERAPEGVASGFSEYQKRLSHWLPLTLHEIAPGLRGKVAESFVPPAISVRAAAACPSGTCGPLIAGAVPQFRTLPALEAWRQGGRDLAFLIGGPEGHAPEVMAAASESWSLGPLTLPHMMVRLIVLEQLYRAASMLANHPYHRG